MELEWIVFQSALLAKVKVTCTIIAVHLSKFPINSLLFLIQQRKHPLDHQAILILYRHWVGYLLIILRLALHLNPPFSHKAYLILFEAPKYHILVPLVGDCALIDKELVQQNLHLSQSQS